MEKKTSDKIIIAYVCDEGYEDMLRKSMASVMRYNKNVEFVVLSNSLKSLPHARVFKVPCGNMKFKFKEVDRMKDGVYYKFWLPILPYDKILYIDCDVLCQRPLNELWNIECDYICATESHEFGKKQAAALGLKKYALTGMMLMNLKALREDNFTSKCLARLKDENPEFHDETIINEEFINKIKFIDCKYNYCRNRKYDNPIPESDAFLLHYVGKANKRDFMHVDNFSSLVALKMLLRNKTVAIVGNNSSIIKSDFGKVIDSHDVVIRFNRGFWWLHPKAVGIKTTLLFLACTIDEKDLKRYRAKYSIGRSAACKNNVDFRLSPMDRSTLAQDANQAVIEQEISNVSQASTGFIGINFALSCQCKTIDVYGFDFFQTPTYYNPPDKIVLHNGMKEAEKILEYEKYGLIKIYGLTHKPEIKEEKPVEETVKEAEVPQVIKIDEDLVDYVAAYGIYPNQPFYSAAYKFKELDYETKLNIRLIAYKAIQACQAYQLDKHFRAK